MSEIGKDSEEPLIGVRLATAVRMISERVLADLYAAGFQDLRPAHQPILRDLWPAGRRMSELAARAGITKPSAAYLVDELERRGYVERTSDPRDGRVVQVRLSERGWAVHSVARGAVQRVQDEWTRLVGEAQMASLLAMLALVTGDGSTEASPGAATWSAPQQSVARLRGRPHRGW